MENIGLIEKIRRLPPEKVQEIEDFVDFLGARTGEVDRATLKEERSVDMSLKDVAEHRAALSTFSEDWDLPEMEVYDGL